MMEEAVDQAKSEMKLKKVSTIHLLNNAQRSDDEEESGDENSKFSSRPIADLYPETTIMVCL